MIPVDFNENLTYKDEDSEICFKLRPMVGPNEAKLFELINSNGESETVPRAVIDEIFDMFVVGWSHPTLLLPQFPEKNQHQFFCIADRNKMVFDIILKSTKSLSVDEKKS